MSESSFCTLGFVLRSTKLQEVYVLVFLLLVAVVTSAALHRRLSISALLKAFIAFSVLTFAALIVLAAANFRIFSLICEENHALEWLTAIVLLAAWIIGLALMIRHSAKGRPPPMIVFLTAGYFSTFWRELEWGEPFFGCKLWYSRNLFRLEAYLNPGYFEDFRESLNLPGQPYYMAHLVISLMFITLASIVLLYLARHRKSFLKELLRLPARPYGRYFLLGFGVFLGSQALGHFLMRPLLAGPLAELRQVHHVGHRILDEPLEFWASTCFLMSMITLWKSNNFDEPAIAAETCTKATEQEV